MTAYEALPVYSDKRTISLFVGMSQRCQVRSKIGRNSRFGLLRRATTDCVPIAGIVLGYRRNMASAYCGVRTVFPNVISGLRSLIFATIRPRSFLAGGLGDASKFEGTPIHLLDAEYEKGIVYRPYDEGMPDWGVTVISREYLKDVFGQEFEIVAFSPIPTTPNQTMIILRRL